MSEGGTGIGKAITISLINAGAKVVIFGRREEPLISTQKEIGKNSLAYLTHDLTKVNSSKEFIEKAATFFGCPTILVNNAGNHLKKPSESETDEDMRSIIETHLIGNMSITRETFRMMKQNNHGSIVFVSSMAALFGIPNVNAYTAAKSAIAGMTRSLAVEWAQYGIRVNSIAPGWINSPMLKTALDQDPSRKNRILERTPMKSFGEGSDIGNAVAFLCSEAAKFITGHQLCVDGGASISF